MKIIANDFTEAEIFKIVREWTELSQEDFAKSIGRKKRVVGTYEQGVRNYTFKTLLDIANVHHLKITIEKENKS